MAINGKIDFVKTHYVVLNWLFIPYNEILCNVHTDQEAEVELPRQLYLKKHNKAKVNYSFYIYH